MLRAVYQSQAFFRQRRLRLPLAIAFALPLFLSFARAQPSNLVGLSDIGQEQIYVYLYLTPSEVRCEALMPLSVMERWQAIPHADPATLTIADQDAAQLLVEEFFRRQNPVTIDGITVTPTLQRLDFDLIDTRDPGLERVKRPVKTADAWIGAVLSYNTAGAPSDVTLKWTMFDDQISEVTALVFNADLQSRKTFTPDDPVFQWTGAKRRPPKLTEIKINPQTLSYSAPGLTLVLCAIAFVVGLRGLLAWRTGAASRRQALLLFGASVCVLPVFPTKLPSFVKVYPKVSADDAATIFETLHKNVYRAFDYNTEGAIYDALARSVSGELLRQLYQDIRGGLEMKEQGRAMSRVNEVRLVDGQLAPPPAGTENTSHAFRYDATWTVSGLVGHWGHSHERTNRYHALFTIGLVADAWKITGIEILREERLEIRLIN